MQSNDYDNVNLFYLNWTNTQKLSIHEKENWNYNKIKDLLTYFINSDILILLNIYLTIYITKLSNNYVYFYDNNSEYIWYKFIIYLYNYIYILLFYIYFYSNILYIFFCIFIQTINNKYKLNILKYIKNILNNLLTLLIT